MNAPLAVPNYVATKELTLDGKCSYHIEGETIFLDVEEITNHRNINDISGTLSLEMWALSEPYKGEDFSGYQIAAATLGQLPGERHFKNCHYGLQIQNPAEGVWNLVIMLREWENGAFVTRDYINFPQRLRSHYKLTLSLDGVPIIFRP